MVIACFGSILIALVCWLTGAGIGWTLVIIALVWSFTLSLRLLAQLRELRKRVEQLEEGRSERADGGAPPPPEG